MGIYVILSFLKKSKPRFYPDIKMQKLVIWMLGKYDEFGEYLDSDTSKKIFESFFEWIPKTCLLLHYKNKNSIFTYLLFKLKALIYI